MLIGALMFAGGVIAFRVFMARIQAKPDYLKTMHELDAERHGRFMDLAKDHKLFTRVVVSEKRWRIWMMTLILLGCVGTYAQHRGIGLDPGIESLVNIVFVFTLCLAALRWAGYDSGHSTLSAARKQIGKGQDR